MAKYTRYVGDDTSALYIDGTLSVVGDHYVIDSKIAEILGVEAVYSDSFWMGGNDYKDVAATLSEIEGYVENFDDEEDERLAKAAELREEARKLIEEADKLS